MNQVISGVIMGVVITVAIILMLRQCESKPIESEVKYIYKTDTIVKYEPFIPDVSSGTVTPPKVKILYRDTGSLREVTLEKVDTNLLIRLSELEDSIRIHENFLKKFPLAKKLLELKLVEDSLTLTTMDITSQITTDIFPIDLRFYKYHYTENTLRHDTVVNEDKDKPKEPIFKKEFNTGLSYSILQKAPLVHFEYPVQYQQFRFSFESTTSIETTPRLNIYLKALYTIK